MTEPMNDTNIAAMVAELRDMANKIPELWPDKAADMLESLQSQLADTQEAYDDTKRLARKIDIAMHGVEGAAKQASLCDLVHPAADLRAQLAAMTEARNAAVARAVVLTEALKKIRDVESYVKHESFFGDPGRVDITPYTKTGEISLAALAEGTPPMIDSKPSGVAWRWKPKDGSVWFYDPDPEWLSRQSPDEIDAEQLFLHPAQPDPLGYALAIEQAAAVADDFARSRPLIATRPTSLVQGRFEGEQNASAYIVAAIRALSPPADRLAAVMAVPEVRALKKALEAMLQSVCGPTGFAEAVRHNSGRAYPWHSLEHAEEISRVALAALVHPNAQAQINWATDPDAIVEDDEPQIGRDYA